MEQKVDETGELMFVPLVESFVAVTRQFEAVYNAPVGDEPATIKGYQKPVFEDGQIVNFELVQEPGTWVDMVSQYHGGERIMEDGSIGELP